MPDWYAKAEKQMKDLIWKISQEQNIDWHFISDSQSINGSIESIASHLVFLKNNTKGPFTDEQLKELDDMKKQMKEDKKKKKKEKKKK